MTNFLNETREAIASSGHTEADIVFIGSQRSGHQCTWAEFCGLADFEYDDGFGTAEVAKDLIVVFADGQQLCRGEYDGSEWWEHAKPFVKPAMALPIANLHGGMWGDLAELNESANAPLCGERSESERAKG